MTTPGQGPLNDPRLTERRGDLSGLNAALFVILVIVAFVAAAYLLATVLHSGSSAASPSPLPSFPAASASASPFPSATPLASAVPSASAPPSATAEPSPTAIASAAIGQPVAVVVGGRNLGNVTVVATKYLGTIAGKPAGSGLRWIAVHLQYAATAAMPYGPGDWSIVDSSGTTYNPSKAVYKAPLPKGTLEAGTKQGGQVTFAVPKTGTLWLVFSGGDSELRVRLPAQ